MDTFVRKYFIYTAIYVATLNTRLARGNQEFRRHVTYVRLRNIRRIIFQWNAIHIFFFFFLFSCNARITRFFHKWKTSVNDRRDTRIAIFENRGTRVAYTTKCHSLPCRRDHRDTRGFLLRWRRNRMLSWKFVRIVLAVFFTHAIAEKT